MNPRRGRISVIVVLIVSLVLSGITRDWARAVRTPSSTGQGLGDETAASLANMNSFALALLLGGLRGPLVMILWTSSESLKNEKNLEDFDTMVEWIRLLQPEFDTVHIFQVWNKAYNISVQMASWANKYTTILDAIDYARRVERERPNNINMLYAIGGIYFDKLGNSTEKYYYRKRVRDESLPHVTRQRLTRNDPGWRRLELDPVLDQSGMILPEMLKAKYPPPKDWPRDSEWNTGAELQYLAEYQPLPYGVSTFGFAYNYHKRAEVLQNALKQKHAQLSELVVDSRPALALRGWGNEEWERGRRQELRAFGIPVPEEPTDLELPTANLAPDAPPADRSLLNEVVFSYDLGVRLQLDAIEEYKRHIKNFTINQNTYLSHMDECRAAAAMLAGDRDYVKAMLAAGPQRGELLAKAAESYRRALQQHQLVVLKYYIDDDLAAKALPEGIRRTNIEALPPEQYGQILSRIHVLVKQRGYDPGGEDRSEFERYIEREQARLKRLGSVPIFSPSR